MLCSWGTLNSIYMPVWVIFYAELLPVPSILLTNSQFIKNYLWLVLCLAKIEAKINQPTNQRYLSNILLQAPSEVHISVKNDISILTSNSSMAPIISCHFFLNVLCTHLEKLFPRLHIMVKQRCKYLVAWELVRTSSFWVEGTEIYWIYSANIPHTSVEYKIEKS